MLGAVFAERLETPGEEVERELRAALAEPDAAAARALLVEVGELYRFPASAAEAQRLLKIAGDAARHEDPNIAAAALRALGTTGARAAAAHVEPWLRLGKPKPEQLPIVVAAIQAAGRLRVQPVIDPLVKLARSSADGTSAEQAFLALGSFFAAPKALRVQVTNKVLEACQATSRRRARWRRQRAPALRALQMLTGRRLNSVELFAAWWKAAKTQKDPFTYRPS
ncbi:MAG: hypothetical protein OER88_04915 [Planctomycetota bacterium]|nr:hypothetical protein [Planctomycetota bacterium]